MREVRKQVVSGELTPEEEEELLNKLAREIVKRGLETPALLLLDVIKPMAGLGIQAALFAGGQWLPFLDAHPT